MAVGDRRWMRVGPALALLGPLAAAVVVTLASHPWYPPSDWALEVLRASDVGTRHTPWVGVASRFGWYHPGPLLLWALAIPYRVGGNTGVLAAAAGINAASVAATVWLVSRRAGVRVAAGVALGCALLLRAEGVSLFVDPWNPWIAMWPFACFVVAVWAASEGDRAALPVAVAAGSFAVQAHVGYAPLVLGIAAVGGLLRALDVRSHRDQDAGTTAGIATQRAPAAVRWRLALLSLGIGLLLWAAPIVQQVAGHPGNLGEIVRYFRHPAEPTVGWHRAVGVLGRELSVRGPWHGGRELDAVDLVDTAAAWPAVLLLAAVTGLAAMAWRQGAKRPARFAALAVSGALIGTAATARVTGGLAPYLVRWWWPVAMAVWVAGVWCAATVIGELLARRPTAEPPARPSRGFGICTVGLLAGALALTLATMADALPTDLPQAKYSTIVGHLAGPTRQALAPGHTYLVASADSVTFGGVGVGLYAELDHLGASVRAEQTYAHSFGAWRTAPGTTPYQLIVVPGLDLANGWRPPVGARIVASYDPLSPAERTEADRLRDQIRAALGPKAPQGPIVLGAPALAQVLVNGGADRRDVDRLGELQRAGDRYVVFEVRPLGGAT